MICVEHRLGTATCVLKPCILSRGNQSRIYLCSSPRVSFSYLPFLALFSSQYLASPFRRAGVGFYRLLISPLRASHPQAPQEHCEKNLPRELLTLVFNFLQFVFEQAPDDEQAPMQIPAKKKESLPFSLAFPTGLSNSP